MLLHFRRMQMQPHVARDHQDPVARGVFVTVPEDRLPGLRIGYLAFGFVPVKLSHPLASSISAAQLPGDRSNQLITLNNSKFVQRRAASSLLKSAVSLPNFDAALH